MSLFDRHEPGFNVVHQVSANVYTFATEFFFQGTSPLHNRSVIVHVPAASAGEKGTLAVINPAELRPEVAEQLRRLEEKTSSVVRYLISPGDWHYLFIGQHKEAFPEARAYVPPGRIPSKRPGFEYTLIDVTAENPFPELAPHLVALNFEGLLDFTDPEGKLPRHELVFFLPAARAITAGDALWYFGVDELSEQQKTLGQRARVVDFHFARRRMVQHAEGVRRSLERILTWDFDRYISVHGAPGNMLEAGAKADVEKILAWARELPASAAPEAAS